LAAVFEAGATRSEAEKVEKFIKKQKSKTLVLKLINPEFQPNGKLAQLVRVSVTTLRGGINQRVESYPDASGFQEELVNQSLTEM
jgi:hypothetical protein